MYIVLIGCMRAPKTAFGRNESRLSAQTEILDQLYERQAMEEVEEPFFHFESINLLIC